MVTPPLMVPIPTADQQHGSGSGTPISFQCNQNGFTADGNSLVLPMEATSAADPAVAVVTEDGTIEIIHGGSYLVIMRARPTIQFAGTQPAAGTVSAEIVLGVARGGDPVYPAVQQSVVSENPVLPAPNFGAGTYANPYAQPTGIYVFEAGDVVSVNADASGYDDEDFNVVTTDATFGPSLIVAFVPLG